MPTIVVWKKMKKTWVHWGILPKKWLLKIFVRQTRFLWGRQTKAAARRTTRVRAKTRTWTKRRRKRRTTTVVCLTVILNGLKTQGVIESIDIQLFVMNKIDELSKLSIQSFFRGHSKLTRAQWRLTGLRGRSRQDRLMLLLVLPPRRPPPPPPPPRRGDGLRRRLRLESRRPPPPRPRLSPLRGMVLRRI